jgi:hypothetical protein
MRELIVIIGCSAVALVFGWFLAESLRRWRAGCKAAPPADDRGVTYEREERLLGDRIDFSISLYARLLESDSDETLFLEIARARIEYHMRKFEEFQLRKFESQVTK